MVELNWAQAPRLYDEGVDRGVLYLGDGAVVWNGLVSVNEKETGSIDTTHFLDGIRLHITQESGTFEASIEAFTYPDEFAEYNGYSDHPTYERFGFSYRTGTKIHLVYNALVKPSNQASSTLSDSPHPSVFTWDISTTAIPVPGARPAAHLVIDTTDAPEMVEILENFLYGTAVTPPELPTPEELVDIFETGASLRITYLGNGVWTATGPDNMLQIHGDGSFSIISPTAFLIGEGKFTVASY